MLRPPPRRRPVRRPYPLRTRLLVEPLEDRTLPAVGLVLALGFDEGSGTVVNDVSGSNNNGTISGAVWNSTGRFGQALSFDGINDWVTVNDAASLDLTTGMTVEAWINPTLLTDYRPVLSKEGNSQISYLLYANDGEPRPAIYVRTTADRSISGPDGSVPLNQWTHLAATYDGANLRMYVNGVLGGTFAVTGAITTSNQPLHIGGSSVFAEFYKGLIDEVRIYNRPLSQAEIQTDMTTPVQPSGPDTTPPTVTVTAPVSGATSVSPAVNVTATFSEAIDPATITSTNFELRDPANALVAAGVSWNSGTLTATLDPTANLAMSTIYTARLKSGTTGIKDVAGNSLASDFVWSFTTAAAGDTTPPTVTATTPTSGATGVSSASNVTATFNETIDPTTITVSTFELRDPANALISAAVSASGTTATLNPSSNLAAFTIYSARLKSGATGVKDLAGNPLVSDVVWSFTTQSAPTGGLVLALGFNEGSGTLVNDVSGLNNNGTISGAVWNSTGRFGQALSFDGINDWVTVNDAASLDLTTGMTVEAWINPTLLTDYRPVLSKEGNSQISYLLYANDGEPRPAIYVRTTADRSISGPDGSVPLNQWTHLAATYDGANLQMYVNGVLGGTFAVTGAITTSNQPLHIGGSSVFAEFYKGLIDEVRVYNRPLSQAEIQTDMATPVGPVGPDTTPPTVTATAPTNGAVGVSPTITVTATFSEAINPTTVTPTTFELRDPSNVLVAAGVSANGSIVTLDPNSDLLALTTYTVRLKGGASGVKDFAGNPLATDFVWSFTTGDTPPPPTTGNFQDTVVLQGLSEPTAVRFASDGRVFVAEKRGIIKVFDNLNDTTPTIFADLRTNVHNFWDRGLLGLALDPNFPTQPYVYVLYTYDANIGGTAPKYGSPNQDSDPAPDPTGNGAPVSGRLSRLTASGNVMTGPELVLVNDWPIQYPSHSVGSLVFGPDGALYASGGDGASFTYVDYGQTVNPFGDPSQQGGALRSQDLLSSGDPVTLDGSIIRINPSTGAGLSDNPLAGNSDANAKRIIAHGLRNPFRITVRPGTDEIWVGDVGWDDWEEINRIVDPNDAVVENFGWPAYEGPNPQGGYEGTNLPLLQPLYDNPNLLTDPYWAYNHGAKVDASASGEPTGTSSITGLAFYTGSNYPAQYQNALFFVDYSRQRLWVMLAGANGLPDPATRTTILTNAGGPVDLQVGPGGDLFYVNLDGGSVHHLEFFADNRPPTAVIQANPQSGPVPLTVNFNGTGSSDPDGDSLSYAWDLDGDGAFDDSTSATPSFTYTTGGNRTVRLRVTDPDGASGTTSILISAGNTPPQAVIDTPVVTETWYVGETIAFSGRGLDTEQGTLAASALNWELIMHHGAEPDDHEHSVQTFAGVSSGSFIAPDHGYPSHLELRLTVTDAGGLQSTASIDLDPETLALLLQSNPVGVPLGLNSESVAAPFTRTVIVSSTNSISAPAQSTSNNVLYQFASWSDGGAQSHLVAPGASTTYTASYTVVPPTISIGDVSVTEGNTGSTAAVFTVSLSSAHVLPVTVTYSTANGTATAGSDYTAVAPTVLTFDPGQTSKTVSVNVLGETALEANETFFVNLSSPTNAALSDAQGQGTITDDDAVLIGSDAFGYKAYVHTFQNIDLVPGAAGVFTILTTGNNVAQQVTLTSGLNFTIYGTTYTSLYVSTNGLITFGSGVTTASNTNLASSPNQRSLAVMWDDWIHTTGNPILLGKYEDTNSDGTSDRLIIEWNKAQGATTSPSQVTFQAILQLNTGATPGDVIFNYVDLDAGNSRSNGGSATVGIKRNGTQNPNRILVSFNSATSPYVGSGKAIRFTTQAAGAGAQGLALLAAGSGDPLATLGPDAAASLSSGPKASQTIQTASASSTASTAGAGPQPRLDPKVVDQVFSMTEPLTRDSGSSQDWENLGQEDWGWLAGFTTGGKK